VRGDVRFVEGRTAWQGETVDWGMPPILNAQGVSKRFGAVPLFDEIAFTVSDGDRIGLIGPNGAGKSTLLKVLAGEEEPDAGDVAMRKRARIAYVRQESGFAPGLTIRDVLEKALEVAGVPEGEREGRLRGDAERRVAEAAGDRRGNGDGAGCAAAR
jgi:ATP-binding cassette subfamily F protein uup